MISYDVDIEGIMQVVFAGDVTYKDIINWLKEFSEIPNLQSKINIIYDLRDANLILDMVSIIQVAKRTDEATMKFEQVRTVFLIEESKLKSYTQLFSFLKTKRKTKRKVFSNTDEAIDWLLAEE